MKRVSDSDRFKLLGKYKTPSFKYGQIIVCEVRGELEIVGRRMPWTMAAFTIGALAMVGVPPMAGFVSKWYLGIGAMEAGCPWVVAVLVGSTVLNAIYFLPIVYAAWFKPPHVEDWRHEIKQGRFETSLALLIPPLVTALLTILAGVFAGMPFSPLSWVKFIVTREFQP